MYRVEIILLSFLLPVVSVGQNPPPKPLPPRTTSPTTTVTVTADVPKDELEKERRVDEALKKGRDAYAAQRYQEALPYFLSAVQLAERLRENKSRYLEQGLKYVGDCYRELHRYQEAETAYIRRSEVQKDWPGTLDGSYAANFLYLAVVQMLQQNWEKAEEYCSKSIATYEQAIQHFKRSDEYDESDIVANDDRREESEVLYYLAIIYANEGKDEKALATREKGYTLGEKFHATPESLLSRMRTLGRLIK